MNRRQYKGRVEITREFLGFILGLPENVGVDIYHDYTRDMYNIVMRSAEPVYVNGHQVTSNVQEGCGIPFVDCSFIQPVLIVSEDPELVDESYLCNAQALRAKDNQ